MKEYPNVYVVTYHGSAKAVFYEASAARAYCDSQEQKHAYRIQGPFKCN